MAYFRILSHCFTYGYMDISPAEAAPIMGISKKMATNYATDKNRPDPVRLAYLQAVVGKKIIPTDAPLWWDNDTQEIRTDTGHGFGAHDLDQYAWLRRTLQGTIDALRLQIDELKREIHELKEQPAPTPAPISATVLPFPTHKKEN